MRVQTVVRNIASTLAGIAVYFVTDTVVGILAGILLTVLTPHKSNTIYFQIVLKYIVAACNARLIPLVVNCIAPRTGKGVNISEYIIGSVIIVFAIAATVMCMKNQNLDAGNIIFCIANLMLGIFLFFDAREQSI